MTKVGCKRMANLEIKRVPDPFLFTQVTANMLNVDSFSANVSYVKLSFLVQDNSHSAYPEQSGEREQGTQKEIGRNEHSRRFKVISTMAYGSDIFPGEGQSTCSTTTINTEAPAHNRSTADQNISIASGCRLPGYAECHTSRRAVNSVYALQIVSFVHECEGRVGSDSGSSN